MVAKEGMVKTVQIGYDGCFGSHATEVYESKDSFEHKGTFKRDYSTDFGKTFCITRKIWVYETESDDPGTDGGDGYDGGVAGIGGYFGTAMILGENGIILSFQGKNGENGSDGKGGERREWREKRRFLQSSVGYS